jgi:hypothetical protein
MRAITQGRRISVEQIPALGAKARALNSRLVAQREGEMDPNDVFAMILKQLWELVVKPVLEWLKFKVCASFRHNFHPLTGIPEEQDAISALVVSNGGFRLLTGPRCGGL